MSQPTPETDAEAKRRLFVDFTWVRFAQSLERQRDEARRDMDAMQLSRAEYSHAAMKLKKERDALRAELADERAKKSDALIAAITDIQRLTTERDAALARVKELEADKARLDYCDTMIDIEQGYYVLRFPVRLSCTIRDAIDAAIAKGAK